MTWQTVCANYESKFDAKIAYFNQLWDLLKLTFVTLYIEKYAQN